MNKIRCGWVTTDPLYLDYHDTEWGVPEYDDRKLFEMLILEGAQAGLSWLTVLKKREHYRKAFANFHAKKIAAFTDADVARLLADAGIIRNRLKIAATIQNAKAFLTVQKEDGSFADYLWRFVDGQPKIAAFTDADVARLLADAGIIRNRLKIAATIQNAKAFLTVQQECGSFADYLWRFVDGQPKINAWSTLQAVPARTAESDAMSKDLLKRGFKFVGSTICYAFMQATGMVNDHVVECFRYTEGGTRPKSKV